jgi:SNF2 family DNA or RNA helicase
VGVEVLAPKAATRAIRAAAHVEPPPGAGDAGSHFDLSTLCELTWRPTLDGEPLSPAELTQLASTHRPLVRLRDEWVVVDPRVIAQLARAQQVSAADALAGALAGELKIDGESVPVDLGGELESLTTRLRSATAPHELGEPSGLVATLRPYQRRGLGWLSEMTDLGFGGILADDMGLGKTVQLIALHLERLGGPEPRPTLVACPATLVANWENELARFAPTVPVRRYHGTDRSLGDIGPDEVVVTTYGVVRRDHELLSQIHWGLVVADEAQQIKNPNAAISKALRTIGGQARLAMTGTPVENRLTELWALLDWTTPGLLGGVDAFRRNLAIPIEREGDAESTARLARLVAPFVLRRRKLDPDVAPDLPPKIETDHPVTLTTEQASLYRAVVEESLEQIEGADGIARRGLVLKLLTGLKQICNHPAQYLRQPGPLPGRSGKLEAFDDLVDAIGDAGDFTLVFTQYVAMGELLGEHLGHTGIGCEFLHGSLTLPRRADMVERFQAGEFPVFLISLKAGGTGLNLTRATHVIHYDRWWNPAVENQASDRAWRIGQDRAVQIHRLITQGTLEERIAQVLAQKAELAEAVIGGGESWLTELSDSELADLVQLGTER